MKPVREKTVVVATTERCRRPKCYRPAVCRGLCASDYQVAYQLVHIAKVTTWEQLERNGKADEPKRTAKAWFLEIS